MTITNWYKWANDAIKAAPQIKPKVIPGFDCLDDRLQAVLREQGPHKNSLKRKPAGGGQKQGKAKKTKARISSPRFHKYQKLYSDNLQDLKRCAAGKCNEYKFRSKPVPNFARSHQLLQKRKQYFTSIKKLTKPKSPRTLVTSMKALIKRNNEESKELSRLASRSVPKINSSKSMDYMIRKPFKPHTEISFTRPKPFRLHTSKRALIRFLYDKEKRVRMEERFLQLANEWLESERREYFRLRKLTNFKANPNPWREKLTNFRPTPSSWKPDRGYYNIWQGSKN
ncbi:uncharacterized protein LOC110183928 [Drosophila serrata]|uniref:uncharacterized protein LOC110183928 n=1 Tax=Drosophila serrata TaxID=7274 RepID=UPI000A1D39CD|nr:uncharacterized protein LOC110183928 [Drosophila serrata]